MRSDAFPWLAGVDIFFVISGFIMVYASSRWFGSAQSPRVFLAHRIARIVPLYWATTMLYLAVVLFAPALLNSEYLAPGFVISSFLFIPAARPDGLVQPLYSLGWTLNYEMFFYALFAIAIAFPRRRGVPALIGGADPPRDARPGLRAPAATPCLLERSDHPGIRLRHGVGMGERGRLPYQPAGPARLGARGSCALGARPYSTGELPGPSAPPRLWPAGGPPRRLRGACFTRAARARKTCSSDGA